MMPIASFASSSFSSSAAEGRRLFPASVGPGNERRVSADDFASYVARLDPAALADVLTHLDEERYPRRVALVRRELATRCRRLGDEAAQTWAEERRGLVRLAAGVVLLAVCAGLLRALGACTLVTSPHERLPFFTDLAVASPDAARLLFPLAVVWGAGCAGTFLVRGAAALLAGARMRQQRLLNGGSAGGRRDRSVMAAGLAVAVVAEALRWWLLRR